MSNYAAVAHVTEAFRVMLEAEVKNIINSAVGSTLRPGDDIKGPCVNIFLYHVSPSAALRAHDAPTRDSRGTVVQRSRAALDLHYLLTFHGSEANLEPQRMLGTVVRALHSKPVLTQKAVIDAAEKVELKNQSNFAETGEAVHFSPIPLSLDDLSKLWSVLFQSKYVLSLAYQASVVTVEEDEEPPSPLPVLTRNVVVFPSFGPIIDRAASKAPPPDAPVSADRRIVAGDVLVLFGRNFSSPKTRLRIGDGPLIQPTSMTDSKITVELKAPPLADVHAGAMSVQVVQSVDFDGSGDHVAFESNLVSFVLAPRIVSASFAAPNVTVTVDPPVLKDQKLVLLLNQFAVPTAAYRFQTTAASTAAMQTVPVQGVAAGTYFVRLQVDGAESPLDVDASGHYSGPTVTL